MLGTYCSWSAMSECTYYGICAEKVNFLLNFLLVNFHAGGNRRVRTVQLTTHGKMRMVSFFIKSLIQIEQLEWMSLSVTLTLVICSI